MGKYNSSTGLERFYYGVLDSNEKVKNVKVVDYLKEISLEFDEDLEKAYGSNKVAEIAKSNGETSLSATFHRLPIEAQQDLLGLVQHKSSDGVYGFSNATGINYTACAFARTMEDGSKEWFGLGKGVFTRPAKEGQTKEDGVEFGEDEIEGQFMETDLGGFDDQLAVIMAYDEKGQTQGRDTVFQSIFGKSYSEVTEDLTKVEDDSEASQGGNEDSEDKLKDILENMNRDEISDLVFGKPYDEVLKQLSPNSEASSENSGDVPEATPGEEVTEYPSGEAASETDPNTSEQ
ncbi:major tail protein [Staphylococcus auricularis]|uniref:major tail protein n=1 Tax=Staphylococcus auricularis TaxID=29379 RepID=UPI002DB70BCC|nr:major tail protein [Staphylococcus auricularis]MEB6569082.1 phage tail protein [Staphylococcus auricularis]